jgi:hypothetical protein
MASTGGSIDGTLTLPLEVFQDAFHIGQALERRLVQVEIASQPVASTTGTDPSDPEPVALGGVAEMRAWAGSVLVHAYASPSGSLAVRISGEDYADFGLSGPTDANASSALKASFAFVYGPPWQAECAAHLRSDCPLGFEDPVSGYVQHPTDVCVDSAACDPDYFDTQGQVPPVFVLTVPYWQSDPRVTHFLPPQTVIATPQNSHLYMIRLASGNPNRTGQVLGVIKPSLRKLPDVNAYAFSGTTSFAVSPMQRELLEDTIDVGKWVGSQPPAIGNLTAADTPGYCVDGVPRDVFVPLQNELTSTGTSFEDSWQFYLQIATQAAQTADQLGQQLLQQNLAISEREEAAGEQLATLCGDVGALSQVSVDTSGHVTAGAGDPTLAACLSEPTTDVVFLSTQLPQALQSASDKTGWLKSNVLQCSGVGSSDPLCQKSSLSYDTLGVVQPITPAPPNNACGPIAAIAASDSWGSAGGGFEGTPFHKLLNDPTFSAASMQTFASALQLNVDLWGNWQVTFAGAPILDSTAATLWPGCLRTTCANVPSADALSKAFRWCPANLATTSLAALGTCDATDVNQELNMLRWRVQGALWMVAASAGAMPPNMFNMPIPVATWPPSQQSVALPAAYPGQLVPTPASQSGQSPALNGYQLQLQPGVTTSADQLDLGTVWDIAPSWGEFTAHAANEIPAWYRGLYNSSAIGPAGFLKHGWYQSASLNWPNCAAGGFVGGSQSNNGCPGAIGLGQLLDAAGPNIDGLVCTQPFGSSSPIDPVGTSGNSFADIISGFKTGYDTTDFGGANALCGQATRFPPFLTGACVWSGPQFSEVYDCRFSDWNTGIALWADKSQCACESIQGAQGQTTEIAPGCGVGVSSSAEAAFLANAPSNRLPWQRSFAFANLTAENGTCNALAQLVQTAALVCTAQAHGLGAGGSNGSPPQIHSVADIPLLQAWLSTKGTLLSLSVQQLFVEGIPNRVISDFKGGQVGLGSKAGTHGTDVLNMEQALTTLPAAWANVGGDLQQIASAIAGAQLALQAAQLSEDSALNNIAIEQLRVQTEMAQQVSAFVSQVASLLPEVAACASTVAGNALGVAACASVPQGFANAMSAGASAAIGLASGAQELTDLNQQITTDQATQANQVAQALNQLNAATVTPWTNIQDSLGKIRSALLSVQQAGADLQLTSSQAAYQAAIGTGADFATLADGETLPVPVNTVLRRQASATELRYQAALINAKALAYMARRAIEQRLGVPLSALTTAVGPLDPPASWADDICSSTGINYKALATASSPDAGGQGSPADQQVITQFANSWVGDYVAKLSNFVQYFNVQYPSHQGQDTAILSLREDLLPPLRQCTALAPNLLLESGDLDDVMSPGAAQSRQGWVLGPCDSVGGKCLTVLNGNLLGSPQDGPIGAVQASSAVPTGTVPGDATGIAWLSDVSQAVPPADAGASEGGAASPIPPGAVVQAVNLSTGSYILSWWDQARDASGNLPTGSESGPETAYDVRVLDGTGRLLGEYSDLPFVPAGTQPPLWGPRRAISFSVPQPATYYVAFGASVAGSQLGSVAIADVQLEVSQEGQPTPYVATTTSRMVPSTNCTPSDSDLRAAFQHVCSANGNCWYQLTTPIVIDTQALNSGTSSLGAKLAQANYNFRHVNLALNLVGTDVHDCSNDPTQNCFGSGYIEYTLQHDATNAKIVDYNGNARVFDFGTANVQHGKALAAERYITLPISANDQGLISQPGVQHIEFQGRPLDGVYQLQIWDSPDLRWSNLQDVQIVLNYEYWSEIIANGNSKAGQ